MEKRFVNSGPGRSQNQSDPTKDINRSVQRTTWFIYCCVFWCRYQKQTFTLEVYTNCSFLQTGRRLREDWFFVMMSITKTCLYNFDPLKPNFYIVKLGFTGVYIIFLIFAHRGSSNWYLLSMF